MHRLDESQARQFKSWEAQQEILSLPMNSEVLQERQPQLAKPKVLLMSMVSHPAMEMLVQVVAYTPIK
jgi:hypothetical protein